MRVFLSAAAIASASLAVIPAFAAEPPVSAGAPPIASAPPVAVAPPAVAPAAAAMAPAPPGWPGYAPMAPYAPGYPAPYALYPAPGAQAPYPYWMGAPRVTERRSNGMRITGIALFAAGGLVSAVGAVIFGATVTTPCVDFATPTDNGGFAPPPQPQSAHERVGSARQALNGCDTSPGLGLGVFAGGLLTAVIGIPLYVIGNKQTPVQPALGALVPRVSVGDRNATLRWSF